MVWWSFRNDGSNLGGQGVRSTLSAVVTENLFGLGRIQLGGSRVADFPLSAQPVIACPALRTAFFLIKTICKGRDLRFLVDIRLFWSIDGSSSVIERLGRSKATAIGGAGQGTS